MYTKNCCQHTRIWLPLLEKFLRPPMLVLCCLLRAAKLTESKLEQTIVGKQTRFYLGSWIDTSTCFDKTFSYADAAAARDIRATAEDILHCWALLVRRYEAGLRECARAGWIRPLQVHNIAVGSARYRQCTVHDTGTTVRRRCYYTCSVMPDSKLFTMTFCMIFVWWYKQCIQQQTFMTSWDQAATGTVCTSVSA